MVISHILQWKQRIQTTVHGNLRKHAWLLGIMKAEMYKNFLLVKTVKEHWTKLQKHCVRNQDDWGLQLDGRHNKSDPRHQFFAEYVYELTAIWKEIDHYQLVKDP